MKHIFPAVLRRLMWSAFALIFSNYSQAAVFTVSNIPGRTASSDLQAVIDAASSGDTIYVEGSPTSYGDITLTKKLNIFGPGYFLTENFGLSAEIHPAQIGHMYIKVSGDGDDPSGSVLTGLSFSSAVYVGANSIAIRRCYSNNSMVIGDDGNNYLTVRDVVIQGCYLLYGVSAGNNFFPCYNTVIEGDYLSSPLDLNGDHSNGIIANCIIVSQSSSSSYGFKNYELYNNVFMGNPGNMTSCVAHHNVVVGTSYTLPGTDNVFLSSSDGLFVDSGTTDGKWQLAENSPARGVGVNGADCGPFWNSGYVLSGIPSLPVITKVELPAEVSNRSDLQLSVEVRVQR